MAKLIENLDVHTEVFVFDNMYSVYVMTAKHGECRRCDILDFYIQKIGYAPMEHMFGILRGDHSDQDIYDLIINNLQTYVDMYETEIANENCWN